MTETAKARLLVLDDETDMLRLLKRSLEADLNCVVETAGKAVDALTVLEEGAFDVVLADIRMPGMDGMEFLGHAAQRFPGVTVVMMTAYGTIDLAVQAIKNGAYDFVTKPFEIDKLTHLLAKALERSRLVKENLLLQRRIKEHEQFSEMVGTSPRMAKIFETIRLVGNTDVTVLLTGESGTGKDVAAKAIHRLSRRSGRAFVAVNCPNLPESILESELFGYKKGAFTHAEHDKHGLFWEAHGGTIYLDEIGDISPTLQTKLLRVLQEKEIRPLGQTRTIKVDVRIIASTNRDLPAKIKDQTFREDLFYRLNVMSLHMPPLRERREDVVLLANHFLQRFCKEYGTSLKNFDTEFMNRLMQHSWPGNVRELENVVRRAVLLSQGPVIRLADAELDQGSPAECLVSSEDVINLPYKEAKARVLERFHEEYLNDLLDLNQRNVTKAARACGLERQALQQIMRRYGVRSRDTPPEDADIGDKVAVTKEDSESPVR